MDDEAIDSSVLQGLCKEGPCKEDDLKRELGIDALDGVARLVQRGLAYRMQGGFVIASAAGRHANSIDPTWA
ncbi:MAG TPA: hypothetical protein VH299_04430 [Solirubrobacterales bacterium]|jgi:hypothetical protein|nr:hypothetical protein [Solirubrobacterales bacterium]